ncbi:restriction endonuclease subunit S [Streptomyces phaeochromogenes]|uniref:restriction endonuclease subunit S n=1 Tax=Streptomyces phaeochromogenes TaxID=1923 RepID=UPI0038644311|nr:restriction endonuclease subunit S [Streptomyces phaeochromogenes]
MTSADADWPLVSLSEVTERIMVGIASAATHAYRPSGVPMIRNQNIKPGRLDDRDLLHVDPRYERAFKNKRLREGDLLTVRTGYPGTTCVVPAAFEGAQSFTTLISRPQRAKVDSQFLSHYINSELGQSFFTQSQIGGAQKNVNAGVLRGMPLPLPTTQEQRAVVAALDSADSLIETIERMVAKKRNIKQGLMQELLTGRSRVPGYSGEWHEVRLGDVGNTYGGLTGKGKSDFGLGNGLYVAFTEVMEAVRLVGNRLERVRVRPRERQNQVQKGDVLFNGSSETPEEVALAAVVDFEPKPGTFLNSFCFGYRLENRQGIDPSYLAYFFRSAQGRTAVSALAQGATRYNIAKTKLMDLSPLLPPVDEQRAIAAVLRDAEDEIGALQRSLTSARDIKTGMTQELLTGRTRLHVEAAS